MAKKQAAPRVILIVGANRGIGYYMAEHLLELGDFISVLDIETDNLKELKEYYPDKVISITADAAKDEDIKNGVAETIKQFGEIDIAVHNACLCTFDGEPNSDYEIYNRVMDINFFGALRLSKAVLPEMSGKQAVAISTAAGGGMKSTVRDMADSLGMWGIRKVYKLGFGVQATKPDEIPDRIFRNIHTKTDRLADRIRKGAGKRGCNGRAKKWFYLMRFAHKHFPPMEPDYGYWEKNGWHKSVRPWNI